MSKGISGLFRWTIGHIRHIGGRIIPGKDGVVTGGKSKILGENLMQEMGLPKSFSWEGYQAQHIIPAGLRNHPVLQKIGMDLDHASNGIFLPEHGKESRILSRHKGYHKLYSKFVRSKLDQIDVNQPSLNIQKQVHSLQTKLRRLQESGLPLYKGFSKNDGKSKVYPYRQGNTLDMWKRRYDALN